MDDEDRYTRITLRIPKDLQGQIARAAVLKSRSQNAEIISRLEKSFRGQPSYEESPVVRHDQSGSRTLTIDEVVELVVERMKSDVLPGAGAPKHVRRTRKPKPKS